jgi:hypothetical protein
MARRYMWLGGVALGAVPALAEEPPAEVRSLREVRGPISAVDTRKGTLTLTLEEPSGRVELRVDGETTIFLPGRTGRLADLKAGQRVRAAYEPGVRVSVAQWIELLEP